MKRLTTLGAGILLLVLTGCSPDAADSAETTTTEAQETVASADSAERTTTTTVAPTTTTTETVTVSGGADCLVGDWVMNSSSFLEQMMEMFAGDLQGATFEHTGGTYLITFGSDGTMSAVRDMWTFEVSTADGKIIQTIDSVESGTYVVDGNTMTAELVSDSFDFKSQVEVDGQILDLPSQSVDLPENAVNPAGAFNCEDGTLTVATVEGMSVVFDRS